MARLEVHNRSGGYDVVALDGNRLSVGKSTTNDLVVDEPSVSRAHAVMDRIGDKWSMRDVGSTNGTTVNGTPLFGEKVLRNNDEIMLGRARMTFRSEATTQDDSTARVAKAPDLTRGQKKVLRELVRPILVSDKAVKRAAGVHDIAEELVVTDAAVKAHLGKLYDAFGIPVDGRDTRRDRLADAALETGAITRKDVEPPDDE